MNDLNIKATYISNYTPTINIKNSKGKKQYKLFVRYIFIYYLFLKKFYLIPIKNNSITFFVKPKKKKAFTLLRAPYRYKLARLNIVFSRYYINISFTLTLKNLEKNNYIILCKHFKKLSESFSFSNLTLHKINYKFKKKFKNNFLIEKF